MTRRRFVRGAATALGLAAAWPLVKAAGAEAGVGPATPGIGLPDAAAWAAPGTGGKIKHVVVLCQENRSFDHYYGNFAGIFGTPGNRAEGFDPTVAYTADNGAKYRPFHLDYYCDDDPDHGWAASHDKWNAGAMDGWMKGADNGDQNSPLVLGYYDVGDHLYHVDLARTFTICDHHFCSHIGPTLPNRLYLWSGTSGWGHIADPGGPGEGLPYDNPSITEPPPVLDWPTMADVLDGAQLPWKCYSVADGSLPSPIGAFNPLIFFEQVQGSPTMLANALTDISQFFTDLATGNLPAVSWIITEAVVSEHPPAPPDMGQVLAARVVRQLMESTAWEHTALFLTYDEAGGYFDHVAPPSLETVPSGLPDAGNSVGPAFRVPLTVVSPYAKKNSVYKDPVDHTSVLQFMETNFGLPQTLEISAGRRTGLGDLRDAFDFTQAATRPALPAPEDLFKLANETVLTTDVHRAIVECGSTIPRWLPPLLGQEPVIPYPTPSTAT